MAKRNYSPSSLPSAIIHNGANKAFVVTDSTLNFTCSATVQILPTVTDNSSEKQKTKNKKPKTQ
jgi:hypothetical protein